MIITTHIQAKYHLDSGEILMRKVSPFKSLIVRSTGGGRHELIVVPIVGPCTVLLGDDIALKNLVGKYDFYLVDKSSFEEKAFTIVDEVVYAVYVFFLWLRRLFKKD